MTALEDLGTWLEDGLAKARGDGYDQGFTAHDDEIAALNQAASEAAEQLVKVQADLAAAVAEVARLTALLEPETDTLFGACPVGGGFSLAAARTVTTKWGQGASVRMFNDAGKPLVVQNWPTLGLVHTSYKPTITAPIDAAAGIAAARAGDVLETWHEADVKLAQGNAPGTFEAIVAHKNAFHDAVKATRPDVLVANTFSVARFTGTENMGRWGAVEADVIGVDFDGGRSTTTYPDYTPAIPRIAAFVKDHGYRYWAVPEFAHARLATDTDGSKRAEWAARHAAAFKAAGALYVQFFEYPSVPNNALTTPAEVAVWKGLVPHA